MSTDVIYTDFQRAFDKDDIHLLVSKLGSYGIYGNLLTWFESFLQGRTKRVRMGSAVSSEILVTSEVGQGSNLGPLLFIIYINYIKYFIKHSTFLLFADDLKLYKSINNYDDCVLLYNNLESVNNWCKMNGMDLETKKCNAVTFGTRVMVNIDYRVDDTSLSCLKVIKDLGIYFDTSLNFHCHVDFIFAKVTKIIDFVKRNSKVSGNEITFRRIYFSYVYPGIIYGSQIWSSLNNSQFKQLEGLNHTFLRFAAYRIGVPMQKTDHDYTGIAMRLEISSIRSALLQLI